MTEQLIPIKDRRIALIGGAGFIGHNLALTLKALGANVVIIDGLEVNNLLTFTSITHQEESESFNRELYNNIINQRIDLLRKENIPLLIHDARDYHTISRVLKDFNPQVIIHLAAIAHAGKSNKNPYSTFDHNLRTLENTLDYSRDGLEHFIFFSSSMVYGNFETEQVTEKTPLNPLGIYGALKLAGEKIVIAYQQVFDLPYTIIRPSALYGPRCVSRRVGQIFIESALNGMDLEVHGEGEERLDFTYIDDLVSGIINVIQHPKSRNETFNLTYGESRSLNDLINVVKSEFPNVSVKFKPRDRLMPFRGTLNIDKAKKLIEYNPQNPIDVGFRKYIEWYKSLL